MTKTDDMEMNYQKLSLGFGILSALLLTALVFMIVDRKPALTEVAAPLDTDLSAYKSDIGTWRNTYLAELKTRTDISSEAKAALAVQLDSLKDRLEDYQSKLNEVQKNCSLAQR